MSENPAGLSADADIPKDLVDSVVGLVETGPVPLGAYTPAEIDAVSGVVHFLEREPPAELVAEAVRSLAARNLITTNPGSDQIEVRGDLGIALAFQQRSRCVIDTRVTGTAPDRPWRFLLMPQPEEVTLEILIDALGIHFYALRTTEEAYERLWDRLPGGDRGPGEADADAVLAASPHTALISVSHWSEGLARETHDVVLAQDGDVCHVFLRDPAAPERLAARGLDDDEWRALVRELAGPRGAQPG
ncbi:MAG: hypothetical protein MUC84_07485 [Solirubrobacteraceae bacterium]|nr:hypothetical protein [Solirubrobacteraceae bacterium]MCU0313884.1 hypothetical protein [Solirubrobacteraceae bacterium]